MNKKYFAALFLIFLMLLASCQYKSLSKEKDSIKTVGKTDQKPEAAVDEGIEKEFDDGLNAALQELEEAEKI